MSESDKISERMRSRSRSPLRKEAVNESAEMNESIHADQPEADITEKDLNETESMNTQNVTNIAEVALKTDKTNTVNKIDVPEVANVVNETHKAEEIDISGKIEKSDNIEQTYYEETDIVEGSNMEEDYTADISGIAEESDISGVTNADIAHLAEIAGAALEDTQSEPSTGFVRTKKPKSQFPKYRGCVVFVSHIPTHWTHSNISRVLKHFAKTPMASKSFITITNSKLPIGCCFIKFLLTSDAQLAVKTLNGFVYDTKDKKNTIKATIDSDKFNFKSHVAKAQLIDDIITPEPYTFNNKMFKGKPAVKETEDNFVKRKIAPACWISEPIPDETYGLSISFLNSLGIVLPLVSTVEVTDLHHNVDENKVREVFSLAGNIVHMYVSKKSTCFPHAKAVIEFDHPVEAVQAISMFNKRYLCGTQIIVRMLVKRTVKFLPAGLLSVGKGLGSKGEPLRHIRAHLDLEKIKETFINSDKQSAVQSNAFNDNAPGSTNVQNSINKVPNSLEQSNLLLALNTLLSAQTITQQAGGNNMISMLAALQGQNIDNNQINMQNLGQNIPNWPQNMPNLGQNTPNLGQNTPNLGQNMAQLGKNTMPTIRPDIPNAGFNMANMGQNPGQNMTNFGQTVPMMEKNMQNMAQHLPTIGQNLPTVVPNTPHFGQNPFQPVQQIQTTAVNHQAQIAGHNWSNSNQNDWNKPNTSTPSPAHYGASPVHYKPQDLPINKDIGKNVFNSRDTDESRNRQDTDKEDRDLVIFSYLPPSVNIQALNSKMREIGELVFSEMTGPGRAIVRFKHWRDAKQCIKVFHRSKVDGQVIDVKYF